MSANFNINFIINEKTQTRVLRLTDTSTGFTLAKGNFSITFPDGSTRIKTDFTSPDIILGGASIDVLAVLSSTNQVLTGNYKIDFVALDGADVQYTSTKTFDFNWVKPTSGIVDYSDSIIPQVQFKDDNSYSPTGSFTGSITRAFSTAMPSNSEVSGQTITSNTDILVPSISSKYYEGIYTVYNEVTGSFTHTSNSWLTISYVERFSAIFDIRQTPNQIQLIDKINAYREYIDSLKNKNQSLFELISEKYDLVIALYSHLIARFESGLSDGSQDILKELLSYIEPYVTHTYQSTEMTPFDLANQATSGITISDGINNDYIGLGQILTFLSSSAALSYVINNNVLTVTPNFGNVQNSFAQGNDARFHDAVTLGTQNGLSLVNQQISLASATQSTAGAMSAADKTKVDNLDTTYQPLDADLTAIAGIVATSGLLKKTAANTWTLDTNTYLTTETDPIFVASPAYGITNTNISNWNTAYGWGNHALVGYLLASTAASTYQPLDADLTAIAALSGTSGFLKKTASNTWALDTNTYLTTETDPIYVASSWYLTTNNSSNWNTAYGWGNHALAGYLTTISGIAAGGELSGTYPNPSLVNSAVIGKVLTGLNTTGGGSISATDTILVAFGKIQNQLSTLSGAVIYQGVWNASTNSPALASGVGTKGYYYKVSVAGSTNLDGTTDWKIGDWAIYNGTTWDKIDNTDSVSSVNGYTGAVSLTTSDISEGTNLYFTNPRARQAISLTTTGTSGAATYNNSTGVLNIPQYQGVLTNPVTGTGTSGQVSFFNGTSTISGDNALFWDNTSKRLGIGATTSPSGGSAKLFLYGGSGGGMQMVSAANSGGSLLAPLNAGGLLLYTYTGALGTEIYTERARIDSSGNLGLGVTPSAWGYGGNIQIIDGGTLGSIGTYLHNVTNAYYDTSWKYRTSSVATRYSQEIGSHIWYTALSGTAGSAITFTQAMTLNASGNLALGVTPSAWSVTGKVFELAGNSGNGSLLNNGVNDFWISSNTYFNGTNWVYKNDGYSTQYHQANGKHEWYIAGSGLANGTITFTQAMTLDASGNLMVGTTSAPYGKFTLKSNSATTYAGLNVFANSNTKFISLNHTGTIGVIETEHQADTQSDMAFRTGGGERVRITTAGNIGIGTTAPLTALTVSGNLSLFTTNQIRLYNSAKNNWTQIDSPLIGGDTEVDFRVVTKTGTFYINASGNVGIGTTSPSTALEVFGTDATTTRTNPYNVLTITAENGYSPYTGFGGGIVFKNRAYTSGIVTSSRIRSVINNNSVDTFGGAIAFDVSATVGGALTQAMLINYNGNVGIGTSTPSSKLTVSSGTLGLVPSAYGTNGFIAFRKTDDSATRWNIYNYTNGGTTYGSLNLSTGDGQDRFIINEGGNVSIGNSNNTYKLDVTGVIRSNASIIKCDASSVAYLDFDATAKASGRNYEIGSGYSGVGVDKFYLYDNTANLARIIVDANGNVGIGTQTALTGYSLWVNKNIGEQTTSNGIVQGGQVQSAVTASANGILNTVTTQASAFTLTNYRHFYANQGTLGAGSAITNQYGFVVEANLIGATTNIGFYGGIPYGSNRYNLYMGGTADNYLAGSLGIGSAPLGNTMLRLNRNLTGNASQYGALVQGTIQSDVTTQVFGVITGFGTQATAFTLPNLYNFYVSQGTFGAGSTVTNQYGFIVDSSFTGATNNFGFYGNIASATGRWNIYMNGTANNYLAGNLSIGTTTTTYKLNWASGTNFGFLDNYTGGAALGSTGGLEFYTGATPTAKIRVTTDGYVGIGTTSPSAKLEVSSGSIRLSNTFQIEWGGTSTAIDGSNANNTMRFWTSDTERMRITSTGNIGIGTSSPQNLLEVRKDQAADTALWISNRNAASASATNSIIFGGYRDSDANHQVAKISVIQSASAAAGDLEHRGSIAFYTQVATTSTNPEALIERMRINWDGNIGIGTNSPNSLLDLFNAGSVQLRLSYSATNFATFRADSAGGLLINATASSYIINQIGGTELTRLTSAGNFGIGTSSPLTKFHVNNANTASTSLLVGNNNGGTYFGWDADNTGLVATYTSAPIKFGGAYSSTFVEWMRITNAGNVGVGVTSPYNKFEIASNAANWNTAPAILFTDTNGNANSNRWIVGNIATDFGTFNIASAPTATSTSFTSRIAILRGGNVGIGTTNPSTLLEVGGILSVKSGYFGGGYYKMNYTSSDAASRSWVLANDFSYSGDFAIYQSTTQTGTTYSAKLYISAAGNVGIGNTNNTYKLDVSGDIVAGLSSTANKLRVARPSDGNQTAAYLGFESTSSNTDFILANNSGGGNLVFKANSSERMRIDGSGNVGIGTSSPPCKFYIGSDTTVATGQMSHNGVNKHSLTGVKLASTAATLRVYVSNYGTGLLSFTYAHSNDGDNGAYYLVYINNSYGTIRTTVVASKLTTAAGMTLTVTINSPGGTNVNGAYLQLSMSAANASTGVYGATIEGMADFKFTVS